jgi:hypothetical protein
MRETLAVAFGVAALALLSFFVFPGHTWLESDSQIYAPILEHLRDPAVLNSDMLVRRPHVSFTLYDELTLALASLTRLDLRLVLQALQLLTRALGIWGVYLIASSAGLTAWPALLVASIFSLGATVLGPTVLVIEYEPVPRAFAVPLLFLAIGLASHGRDLAAGIAGSAAFLLHPPTVYPFWGVVFALVLWPSRPEVMRRRIYALAPLMAAVLILLFASRHQAGAGETQVFFARLDPALAKLQRLRASYIWISAWWTIYLAHFVILFAVGMAGFWRLRKHLTPDLSFFAVGLPVIGMLSMPLSWLLLESQRWAVIPQLQPMRALMFVTAMAGIAAAVAGAKSAAGGRLWEAVVFFALAYLIPLEPRIDQAPSLARALLVVGLAVAAAFSVRAVSRWRFPARALIAATALGAFLLVPVWGDTPRRLVLDTPAMREMVDWARQDTAPNAVFLFPDAGRGFEPGVFRYDARRALYVDWKGGGQVNFLEDLAQIWWERWSGTMAKPYMPGNLARFGPLAVDYVVVKPAHREPGASPAFENSAFVVYKVR